jgi:predicted neuraminidase
MPGGDLLTVWGAGSDELAADTQILASRRNAAGGEWSSPVVVADRPGFADANPVLFVDPDGGVSLFHVEMFGDSFCLGRVVVRTSSDAGRTFGPPRQAFDAVCTMVRNHPIVTRSGRWVLPAYQQAIYQSQFWTSDDAGQSWQATPPLLTLGNNNLQPAVVELADGSLFALMRSAGGRGAAWEGRSTDCGRSWRLAERPDLPNPNSGLELIRLSTGELLLFHNPDQRLRTPLSVSLSSDDGRSWASPRTIEDGPPQLSYPSAIQARDGTIHVVYSRRLERIQHAEFNLGWLGR